MQFHHLDHGLFIDPLQKYSLVLTLTHCISMKFELTLTHYISMKFELTLTQCISIESKRYRLRVILHRESMLTYHTLYRKISLKPTLDVLFKNIRKKTKICGAAVSNYLLRGMSCDNISSDFWPGLGLPSQRPKLSYQKSTPAKIFTKKKNE